MSHKILLKKLENIGIKDSAYNWFKSYITDRSHSLKVGNATSQNRNITYGVPQGSTLGPILFLLYINSLCQLDIRGDIICFADDTVLVFTSDSWTSVYKKATEGINKIKYWLDNNLLTLNIDKTKYMTFSIDPRRQPGPDKKLTIHDCTSDVNCLCNPLTRTQVIKYLGIYIDNYFRWTEQINRTAGKVRKLIYFFKNIRNIMQMKTLKTIYYALAQSIITHGMIGWGGAAKTNIDPLYKAQKVLIKVITKKPYRFSTIQLFKDFPVLSIQQLYIKIISIHYIKDKLNHHTAQHNYETRHKHQHMTPKTNTTYGQRHYHNLAPKIFNLIEKDIKDIHLIKKINLKHKIHTWIVNKGILYCGQITST